MKDESLIKNINKILEKIDDNSIIINEKDLKLFIKNIENLFQNFYLSFYLSNDNENLEKEICNFHQII